MTVNKLILQLFFGSYNFEEKKALKHTEINFLICMLTEDYNRFPAPQIQTDSGPAWGKYWGNCAFDDMSMPMSQLIYHRAITDSTSRKTIRKKNKPFQQLSKWLLLLGILPVIFQMTNLRRPMARYLSQDILLSVCQTPSRHISITYLPYYEPKQYKHFFFFLYIYSML